MKKRSTITSRCLESRPPRIKKVPLVMYSWISYIPQLALISVGKKNRYQHPHKELLDRLEERSISYLRTDERGAIRLIGWDHWRGRNGPLGDEERFAFYAENCYYRR